MAPEQVYKINPNVEFVDETMPVSEVVTLMNTKNISSILVRDSQDMVCGILTERDLVRKFTLLDMADKLTRNVGVVATRQVLFAELDNLHSSIVKLHFEKGLRHFPVLKGKDPKVDNVVGMLTVTDILRHYLRLEAARTAGEAATKEKTLPLRFAVLTYKPDGFKIYESTLKRPTLSPLHLDNIAHFVTAHPKGDMPLVVDMDGWPQKALGSVIVQAKKYQGQLILTTSDPNIVRLFRQYLEKGRQTIVAKPFDPDYLVWVLTAYAAE